MKTGQGKRLLINADEWIGNIYWSYFEINLIRIIRIFVRMIQFLSGLLSSAQCLFKGGKSAWNFQKMPIPISVRGRTRLSMACLGYPSSFLGVMSVTLMRYPLRTLAVAISSQIPV
jgi:hypothetical protein